MNDTILEFPRKKKLDIHSTEISSCLEKIIDLTQSKGGLLFLLKHNDDAAVSWNGDLNTQDMVRLCSLGIYDAYALEKQEEEAS